MGSSPSSRKCKAFTTRTKNNNNNKGEGKKDDYHPIGIHQGTYVLFYLLKRDLMEEYKRIIGWVTGKGSCDGFRISIYKINGVLLPWGTPNLFFFSGCCFLLCFSSQFFLSSLFYISILLDLFLLQSIKTWKIESMLTCGIN